MYYSLGASIAPHAPPSGFTETYFFLICGTQKEDFDMFPRKKVAYLKEPRLII